MFLIYFKGTEHPEITDLRIMYNKTGASFGFVAYNTKYNSITAVFRGTVKKFFFKIFIEIKFFLKFLLLSFF